MHDVAIIGAGVIGSATARELARYQLDLVVIDRGSDAATGASKANSGIVHAGYDAKPGTKKAHYNVAGNPLFEALSEELDFPFKRIGSLILAFSPEDRPGLETLKARGEANGVPGLRILDRDELLALEPNLADGVAAALLAPTGGIVCPYEMTIALAENAAANGARFLLECPVRRVERDGEGFRLDTAKGEVRARVLVNAAGLHSDEINNQLSARKLRIVPRKGEYFLMDRAVGDLVRHTLFQLPGPMGKGVLVTPSVDGNILVGPTSMDVEDKDDTATSREGLEQVARLGARDVCRLPVGQTIASFSGLRAHLADVEDFVVEVCPDVPGLVNLCGIESPGLTSAPAIARDAAAMVAGLLRPAANPAFNPVRRAPPRFRHMTTDERRKAIADNPDYGHVVCRCETVTKAEIVAALRSPLGARDLDAVKRRTRAGMGRCQGGFCSMRLPEIIAREAGIPLTEVTKFGGESRLLLYPDKTEL